MPWSALGLPVSAWSALIDVDANSALLRRTALTRECNSMTTFPRPPCSYSTLPCSRCLPRLHRPPLGFRDCISVVMPQVPLAAHREHGRVSWQHLASPSSTLLPVSPRGPPEAVPLRSVLVLPPGVSPHGLTRTRAHPSYTVVHLALPRWHLVGERGVAVSVPWQHDWSQAVASSSEGCQGVSSVSWESCGET